MVNVVVMAVTPFLGTSYADPVAHRSIEQGQIGLRTFPSIFLGDVEKNPGGKRRSENEARTDSLH
jgi:hypothetical protein